MTTPPLCAPAAVVAPSAQLRRLGADGVRPAASDASLSTPDTFEAGPDNILASTRLLRLPNELLFSIASFGLEHGYQQDFSRHNQSLRGTHPVFVAAWRQQFQKDFVEQLFRYALLNTYRPDIFFRPVRRHTQWLIEHYRAAQQTLVPVLSFALPLTPTAFSQEVLAYFFVPDLNDFSQENFLKRRADAPLFSSSIARPETILQEKWLVQRQALDAVGSHQKLFLAVPAQGGDTEALVDFAVSYADKLRGMERIYLRFFASLSRDKPLNLDSEHGCFIALAAMGIGSERIDVQPGSSEDREWEASYNAYQRLIFAHFKTALLAPEQIRDLLTSCMQARKDG